MVSRRASGSASRRTTVSNPFKVVSIYVSPNAGVRIEVAIPRLWKEKGSKRLLHQTRSRLCVPGQLQFPIKSAPMARRLLALAHSAHLDRPGTTCLFFFNFSTLTITAILVIWNQALESRKKKRPWYGWAGTRRTSFHTKVSYFNDFWKLSIRVLLRPAKRETKERASRLSFKSAVPLRCFFLGYLNGWPELVQVGSNRLATCMQLLILGLGQIWLQLGVPFGHALGLNRRQCGWGGGGGNKNKTKKK